MGFELNISSLYHICSRDWSAAGFVIGLCVFAFFMLYLTCSICVSPSLLYRMPVLADLFGVALKACSGLEIVDD